MFIHHLHTFWEPSEWWLLNKIRRPLAASFPQSKFGAERGHFKITSNMFLFTVVLILQSQDEDFDFWPS